ncbi:hypothetical protein NEUTE1DRAFT_118264 [Neurospora tetrasperma FGSC 2508]|uniref:Uncharacterized protein n=1 Tax=Neurospora tetrasperma (strain FGSC 2508 / ATCC MYA-4615 / P0657) TaxID=510951 RepID=F8MV01_NEUT8|nr:uncharacterized protein NEUTE1DRAFT_118264 [Neurospora tetrasperma FGSC 2508]EGO54626.1 hypothetical protein NEUTE1DRAFT_118264 [Neurospora tetrasperma FGSC 2508]EGZ67921.1 hypothetical protein NEUTE2DRAFT_145769 [Neurospora tetrasperma FGSC 2509]
MDVNTRKSYVRSYCGCRCLKKESELENLLCMRGRIFDGSWTNVCKPGPPVDDRVSG